MGVMRRKEFGSFNKLAWQVVDDMKYVDHSVDVVCYYEEARKIIKELILTGACSIGSIDIHDPDWDCYDKEYYVTVSKAINDEWSIWCEPALRQGKDKYVYCESDVAYVMENCHSKLLNSMRCNVIIETYVVEMDTYEYKELKDCSDKHEPSCGECCGVCGLLIVLVIATIYQVLCYFIAILRASST